MRKGFAESDTKKLAAAICSLAHAVEEASKARKCEFDWLKSHIVLATKQDLKEMECRIMSKFSDYAAEQKEFNRIQEEGVDSIVESISGPTGLAADIKALNDKIAELQNRPDGWTPEDQALLDDIRAKGQAMTAKTTALATTVKDLDSQHPPVVPPTETKG
jgi:hypothetical protein